MCIERITAWAYKGRNYDTELQAVCAAIDTIAGTIAREHSSNMGNGLRSFPALPDLLIRYAELTNPADETAANSAEGTHPEEAEGTREPWKNVDTDGQLQGTAYVAAKQEAIDEMRQMKEPAKDWLTKHGFENVQEFLDRGLKSDLDKWDEFKTQHDGVQGVEA